MTKGAAEYIRRAYGVPAWRGGRVWVDGRPGTITSFGADRINVRFDGNKFSTPCHPTWRVEYLTFRGERI